MKPVLRTLRYNHFTEYNCAWSCGVCLFPAWSSRVNQSWMQYDLNGMPKLLNVMYCMIFRYMWLQRFVWHLRPQAENFKHLPMATLAIDLPVINIILNSVGPNTLFSTFTLQNIQIDKDCSGMSHALKPITQNRLKFDLSRTKAKS